MSIFKQSYRELNDLNIILFTTGERAENKRIKRERRFWNKIAKNYDDWIKNDFFDQYTEIRKKFISYIQKDDFILEIATGTGDIAFNLSDKCKKIIGIDISPNMIEIANKKRLKMEIKNILFQVEDAYRLPFPNSYFDKVICCNGLQTMKNPLKAIIEGKRVLKANGEFLSITYCYGESGLLEQLKLFKWVLKYGLPGYWSNFKCSALKKYFNNAGLGLIECDNVWSKPVIMFLRYKKINK